MALSSSTHTLTSFGVGSANDSHQTSIATTHVTASHSSHLSDHGAKLSIHDNQLDVPHTTGVPHPVAHSSSSHQAAISRRESMVDTLFPSCSLSLFLHSCHLLIIAGQFLDNRPIIGHGSDGRSADV